MAINQYQPTTHAQINYDDQINPNYLGASERELAQASSLYENQDMVKIINTYLEENIPEEVKQSRIYQDFWIVFGKKLQLTFLDKEDKFEFEALFEQARLAYMMSIPDEDFDFKTLSQIKQVELYFAAALRSAVGFDKNKFNERLVLGSTITQNIRSNTEQFGQMGKSGGGGMMGWLNKIF